MIEFFEKFQIDILNSLGALLILIYDSARVFDFPIGFGTYLEDDVA